jgi:DNA uptake protein ComE-like DNA-binding protein
MKKLLKSNLGFSHTEVRGLTLLLILLAAVETVRYNYDTWFPDTTYLDIEFTPFERAWVDSLQRIDSLDYERKRYKAPHEFTGFVFDPNTLPEHDWMRLGFTQKQAAAIIKIRNKGLRFRKKEDLKKLFCVNERKYTQLEPYIAIQPEQNPPFEKQNTPNKKVVRPIEINTADSLALIGIKGIGPYRASKILKRRSQLGGFYSLRQLSEIKGFDDSLLTLLNLFLTVDSSRIKRMAINRISLEDLQKHPYCWYGVGKSIVNYRGNHGPFRSLADLQKIYALKPDQLERLSHYLSFE